MNVVPSRKHRRRGNPNASAYVLILIVGAIVTSVGLSSILIARVQGRTTEAAQSAANASAYAHSILEVIVFRLVSDPAWRSSHEHDTWTAEEETAGMVPLVIMTHVAPEGAVSDALKKIDKLACVHPGSMRMRVRE